MKRDVSGEITGLMAEGRPVLTVNARLARYIRGLYDEARASSGLLAWDSPVVLPFGAWVESLWAGDVADRPLLKNERALGLWEKPVLNDPLLRDAVAGASQAARTAFDAYALMREHRIGLPDDIYLTAEAKALKRWIGDYEAAKKRLGFIDAHDAADRVLGLIKSGRIKAPDKAAIAGLDDLTPRASAFIDALEKAGTEVLFWPETPSSGPRDGLDLSNVRRLRRYRDETEEVAAAARWARERIRPSVRIGFIVPELDRYRDIITRELAEELDPPSILPDGGRARVFNVSLGGALSDEPLVRSALDILSINGRMIDLRLLGNILLSPYFSGFQDKNLLMARIDRLIRKMGSLYAGMDDVSLAWQRATGRGPDDKDNVFKAWSASLRAARGRMLPGEWAGGFAAHLKALGWLKEVRLDSNEFQALEAWRALLNDFSGLDDILGPVSRAEAVAKVASMASSRIHQPETPERQIQVLGLLEAAGQSFDHVWLMGCHENALPSQPSPNPFLPLFVQKRHGLPHSSHEKELSFARSALGRILRSAPEIEASWPGVSDGRALEASPFFKDIPEQCGGLDPKAGHRLKDAVFARRDAIEDMPPEKAIPVADEELKLIRGGTLIIKNQSLCPFKAFATHRLNAAPVPEPEFGLDARDRGSIVHRALEAFWEGVGDSAGLKTLVEGGGLDGFIGGLADSLLKEVDVKPPFSARFLQIERERLASLLKSWAMVEAGRETGFKVKRVEASGEFEISGLKITGKPDRVDLLESGEELILDYKTADSSSGDWLSERPRDPQLMVYATSGRYAGVSFARLKPGDCRFVGITRHGNVLPGVKPFDEDDFREASGAVDWDSLMELWKKTVDSIAAAFMAGVADVDPLGGADGQGRPCEHCELTALCRVAELGLLDDIKARDEDNG